MKKLLLFYFLSLSLCSFAQNIESLKNKTPKNAAERTLILDIIRASLYQDYKQEFIFVVNTLNVSSQFAWFQGTAVRKDGKEIRTNEYDDCCHVERLLKRNYDKWYIVELEAFSTDIWYDGIWDRYDVPMALFY